MSNPTRGHNYMKRWKKIPMENKKNYTGKKKGNN